MLFNKSRSKQPETTQSSNQVDEKTQASNDLIIKRHLQHAYFNKYVAWVGAELPPELRTQPGYVEMISGVDRTTRYPEIMRPIIEKISVPCRLYEFEDYLNEIGAPIGQLCDAMLKNKDIVIYDVHSFDLHELKDVLLTPYMPQFHGPDGSIQEISDSRSQYVLGITEKTVLINPFMQHMLFADYGCEDIPTRYKAAREWVKATTNPDNIDDDWDTLTNFMEQMSRLLKAKAAYLVNRE